MSRRFVVLAGALVGAVTLGACGTTATGTQVSRTIPPTSSTTTSTTTAASLVCNPTTPVVPADGKPTVTVPDGAASTTIGITDIKTGDGPEAKVGDKVSLQYVGVAKSNGKEFDASWKQTPPTPFPFTLVPVGQKAGVIDGWNEGIAGMKVGGRRQLVIPPDKAYGASPPSADIGANDTLVFVVDLVQICSPATTPGSDVPGSSSTTVPSGGSIVPASSVPVSSTTTTAASSSTTAASSTTTGTAKP